MPWFKESPEGDCDRFSFLADASPDVNKQCAIWSSKSHTLFRGKPPQQSILSKSEKNSAPRLHLLLCGKKQCVVSAGTPPRRIILGSVKEKVGPILQRNGERRRQGGGEREALRNNRRRERRQWKRRQSYKFWTSSSKASSLTFLTLDKSLWFSVT